MNGTAREIDTNTIGNAGTTSAGVSRRPRLWLLVNWLLALLTVPVAVLVLIFGIGAVMSTSACSSHRCQGPSGFVFELLFYGAPVVAALTVVISFFTARRGWGIAVPLCALALLGADIAFMGLAFRS